jgi:hypothetical protein
VRDLWRGAGTIEAIGGDEQSPSVVEAVEAVR